MKNYLVEVKVGHVGKSNFIRMILPIKAENPIKAIQLAKNHGGVKRNHKDWCLSQPIEVSNEEFQVQKSKTYNDPYWLGRTTQQLGIFVSRLEKEKNFSNFREKRTNTKRFFKEKNESNSWYQIKKTKEILQAKNLQMIYGI